jgi:hypothetical protein
MTAPILALLCKLLLQPLRDPQIEPLKASLGQCRSTADAITLAIELPRNNRCARLALPPFRRAVSLSPVSPRWPGRPCLLNACQPSPGQMPRIVATSDEVSTIERHGGPPQNARPDYLLKIRLRYSTTLSKTIANVSLNFAF